MEWNFSRTGYKLHILLLLALFCAGSSDECLRMTAKTSSIGDTLELNCPCSESDFMLNWFYKSGTDEEFALVSRGGLNERNYTFTVQNASVGGVYRCACSPDESCPEGECTECFNVSVKPTISSFTVHPPVARVGMSITLMCNATGHPDPVLQDFVLDKASPPWLETLPTLQKTRSGVTVTIKATLKHNGNFKCYVSNAIGQDVADATAIVYEPPVIVSVVNFTASDYTMQSTAAITCRVKNDSTAADVRWTRNGSRLEEGPQFQLDNYLEAENRILSVLIVKNLSRQYIGEYQCIAGSQFNDTDDIRSVWILEDETTIAPPPCPVCHPGVIAGFAVVAVFLTVAVILGMFGVQRCYRDWYKVNPTSEHAATVGFSIGDGGKHTNLSDQTSQRQSSSVSIPRRRTFSSPDMAESVAS